MKHDLFEEQIITQLSNGRKTWTKLDQTVKMSTKTLNQKLIKLMEEGTIERYGVVEFGKIVNYYDLAKKKESEIVLKVSRIFEKPDLSYPITKDLDIEQSMVEWFHYSLKVVMHLARKILDVRFAEELSGRLNYIQDLKEEAKLYASEWMDGFIEDFILQPAQESWMEIFGTYEGNPKEFIKAMFEFSEMLEAKQKDVDDIEVIEVNSEKD